LYTAPSINSESGTELVGIGAMKRLDLYNEKLIDDGILVGSMFDSFTANMVIIAILNILMYLLIYYSLKRKDSI
jgi:hypothetical protein